MPNFVPNEDLTNEVVGFAESDEALYDYQVYQILRWLVEHGINNERALQFARSIFGDRARPLWLRSYGIALVAEHGDQVDLESLEALYPTASSDLERAVVLCSLRRMSPVRRNSVYGRCGGDGFLTALAVPWARRQV